MLSKYVRNRLAGIVCGLCLLTVASCATEQGSKNKSDTARKDMEPRKLENININMLDQNSNELKLREVAITFFPSVNGIRLDFRYGVNSVQIDLEEKNREVILSAMEKYIAQYQEGVLGEANNKKKAYFAKTDVLFRWGLLAPTYTTVLSLRSEYQIIEEGRPYFILANQSTGEKNKEGKLIKDGSNSPAIRMAFSPIQCQKFIELIGPENLDRIVNEIIAESTAFDIEEF